MWITTVPYEEAGPELKASYDRQARKLGQPTEMTLAGSLFPELVRARLDLYAATEHCDSNLSLRQLNLIGFVTSALNGTDYCMSQITIKLRQDGFSAEEIARLARDPLSVSLPAADAALVRYAVKLTKDPAHITEDDVAALRAHGFDDGDIVHANAQCAHLNYVNRVVMGLGIHTIVDPDYPVYDAIPETAG